MFSEMVRCLFRVLKNRNISRQVDFTNWPFDTMIAAVNYNRWIDFMIWRNIYLDVNTSMSLTYVIF